MERVPFNMSSSEFGKALYSLNHLSEEEERRELERLLKEGETREIEKYGTIDFEPDENFTCPVINHLPLVKALYNTLIPVQDEIPRRD